MHHGQEAQAGHRVAQAEGRPTAQASNVKPQARCEERLGLVRKYLVQDGVRSKPVRRMPDQLMNAVSGAGE